MKQTAVQWLVEQLPLIQQEGLRDVIEQAKQMEKEQHATTWDKSMDNLDVRGGNIVRAWDDFDEYYNETYGGNHLVEPNEMIDHIGDANEMIESIEHNLQKIISQAHTKIIRRKGKDYAPTSNEIQKEIDVISSPTEMSNESWEGCDGCTEQDEIMYKNGYLKGYNAAIGELPKEISDEEIINLANEHILYNDSKRQWVIEGMKLYREQLKQKQ